MNLTIRPILLGCGLAISCPPSRRRTTSTSFSKKATDRRLGGNTRFSVATGMGDGASFGAELQSGHVLSSAGLGNVSEENTDDGPPFLRKHDGPRATFDHRQRPLRNLMNGQNLNYFFDYDAYGVGSSSSCGSTRRSDFIRCVISSMPLYRGGMLPPPDSLTPLPTTPKPADSWGLLFCIFSQTMNSATGDSNHLAEASPGARYF